MLTEKNRHAADGPGQVGSGGGGELCGLLAAVIAVRQETDLDEFVPPQYLVGLPDQALGQPAFAHLNESVERMRLTPQPAALPAR
jgi:hypothetical protein